MKRHLIYCGLDSQTMDTDQADQLVRDLAIKHFPNGHTIHEATGRWSGVFGACDEPTLIVEVWEVNGFNVPAVGRFAVDFKNQAAQEAVVILTVPCESVVI